MIEVEGDLFKYPADVVCITTNGSIKSNGAAVMGRGVARTAKEMYPGLDLILGEHIRRCGNVVVALPIGMPPLVSFPAKHNWWEPADLLLIERSAQDLYQLYKRMDWRLAVALPRPGCGNGGLSWVDVQAVLAPILADSTFVVVTCPPGK